MRNERKPSITELRLVWLLLIVTLASACKKNAGCTKFGTENYDPDAIVDDGSCILARDKFLGQFNVSSDCFSDNYQRTISATSDEFVVTISNLADTLGNVDARIYADNITIDLQTIRTGVTIEGAGVFQEEGVVSISYRIRDSRSGIEIIHDCFEQCDKL